MYTSGAEWGGGAPTVWDGNTVNCALCSASAVTYRVAVRRKKKHIIMRAHVLIVIGSYINKYILDVLHEAHAGPWDGNQTDDATGHCRSRTQPTTFEGNERPRQRCQDT